RPLDVVGIPGFTGWGQTEITEMHLEPLSFRWAEPEETVPALVFRADLAVTAGGLASFEALASGTPLLAVSHDAHQHVTVSTLRKAGACVDLGPAAGVEPGLLASIVAELDGDAKCRERLSQRGQQIIDGRGAERVARILRHSLLDRDQSALVSAG